MDSPRSPLEYRNESARLGDLRAHGAAPGKEMGDAIFVRHVLEALAIPAFEGVQNQVERRPTRLPAHVRVRKEPIDDQDLASRRPD